MFKFMGRFLREPGSAQARLTQQFTYFRRLAESNHQVLAGLADIKETASGDYPLGRGVSP